MADKTKIFVELALDKKSATRLVKETDDISKELEKRLRGVGIDYSRISKQASNANAEINAMTKAASVFSEKLGSAATSSFKKLEDLGKKLETARGKVSNLANKYDNATSKKAKDSIEVEMKGAEEDIRRFIGEINDQSAAMTKYTRQLEQLTKVQDKYNKKVADAAKFDSGDLFDGLKSKIASGNFKGMLGELGGGVRKSIEGKYARGAMSRAAAAEGGMGGAEGSLQLAQAGKALSGVAVAIGAIVGVLTLIKKAGDHMASLNKALLNGVGFARDMTDSANSYKDVIDGLRTASIAAHGSMLQFGKDSEDVMKSLNAYARESTGSLTMTYDVMKKMGGGNINRGVEIFAKNAEIYGSALGIEATEVASMMGKFTSDIGYSAQNVTGLMDDIVKSASTANMPLTKFMDIFRQVTPDVDLFSNRMESLTGIIKMLSKNMSPSMVKRFMDEFSKGLKGTSLQERLKLMFTAGGPGKVNNVLKGDFENSRNTLGAQFEQYGAGFGEQFKAASLKGENAVSDFLATVAQAASRQGKQVDPNLRSAAMNSAFYESQRQKGGALPTATAMKGLSSWGAYQLARTQSGFGGTKLGEGINEKVLENLGWSQAKIDMMKAMEQSAMQYRDEIRRFGKTSSKSTNEELKKIVAISKKKAVEDVTWADMQSATEDQIFAAAEASNKQKDVAEKSLDMATMSATATTSISDKIENVIAFLLEKIYNVLSPVLDILDRWWMFTTSDSKEAKNTLKAISEVGDAFIKEQQDKITASKDPKEVRASKAAADALQSTIGVMSEALKGGKTGEKLVDVFAQTQGRTDAREYIRENDADIRKILEDKGDFDEGQYSHGGPEYFLKKLAENPSIMMDLAKKQALEKGEAARNNEAWQPKSLRYMSMRPGTDNAEIIRESKEYERRKAVSDADVLEDVKGREGEKANVGISPEQLHAVIVEAVKGTSGSAMQSAPWLDENQQSVQGTSGSAMQSAPWLDDNLQSVQQTSNSSPIAKVESSTSSMNSQMVGMTSSLESMDKKLSGDGIFLNKTKFMQISEDVLKPMFGNVLEDKLTMFLISLIVALGDPKAAAAAMTGDKTNAGTALANGFGISAFANYKSYESALEAIAKGEGKNAVMGARDFGGSIQQTGNYRLQQGETVLRRGQDVGKTVVVNVAAINVNGAQDPEATAAIVRSTIYNMSEKH